MRINTDPRQFNNWLDSVVKIFTYLNNAFSSIDLLADKINTESSSSTIPAPFLQKTATEITYPDGIKLQGWKLTGGMLLTGANIYAEVQATLTIPSPDPEDPELTGFYIAYDTRGSVKCVTEVDENEFDVVNSFGSGADMRDLTSQAAIKSDYMGLTLDDEFDDGIYVVTLNASAGNANPAEAEVFYQFEFLCYSEVTPTLS